MADRARVELSWDWGDPAVQAYPFLKAKLVASLVLGGLALAVFAYLFVGDEHESAASKVVPVVIGWLVLSPFLFAVVIGNVKRKARQSSADR